MTKIVYVDYKTIIIKKTSSSFSQRIDINYDFGVLYPNLIENPLTNIYYSNEEENNKNNISI